MSILDLNSMVTDFGNEQRMIKLYPGDILFDGVKEVWYSWNVERGMWEKDTQGKIQELTKDMIRGIKAEGEALDKIADEIDDSTDEGKLEKETKKGISMSVLKWSKKCQTPSRIEACLSLLQSAPSTVVSPKDFNGDSHLFNCANGTLNLNTVELMPHDKARRITMSCGWDYDPNAKCPGFEAFINRLFEHHPDREDLIKFVQMTMGYCLSGDIDQQIINMFTGSGSNGKSVLMATIARTFGDYAGTLNGESLTTLARGSIREDLANLEGKRFVSVSEAPKGAIIDEEVIKHLTGGSHEPLQVRGLYGHYFPLYPNCKIFWVFNHEPSSRDMSYGLWRRIKVVPFEETIVESEKREMVDIINEHDEERSGIINWLLDGYLMLQEKKNLNWCEAIKTRTKAYKEDSDVLHLFFVDAIEISNETFPTPYVEAEKLYQAYLDWADTTGMIRPWSITRFGKEITERLGQQNKKRKNGGIWYLGIKLKNQSYTNRYAVDHGQEVKKELLKN